uniref:Uncharacterized protein n=1 Tax=Panagrolaimus sp. ES5 TaxID=591445 RepID=A0AC34F8Q6_9BILA
MMTRPRLLSTAETTTEYSTFEESYTFEHEYDQYYNQMDKKAIKERIAELEKELKEIQGETKEGERGTRKLVAVVNDIKGGCTEGKKALDDALNWPNTLLSNSEKWLAIWESEIGKKKLDNRSAKTAENAILIASVTKQVEYAREWIQRFRERKSHYETTGNQLCEQMKDDYALFEEDIHELRRDCCAWERRAAFNYARTKEMLETKQSLDHILDEKKMLIAEIKNDINEFERELLAISYTLDQIALQ